MKLPAAQRAGPLGGLGLRSARRRFGSPRLLVSCQPCGSGSCSVVGPCENRSASTPFAQGSLKAVLLKQGTSTHAAPDRSNVRTPRTSGGRDSNLQSGETNSDPSHTIGCCVTS